MSASGTEVLRRRLLRGGAWSLTGRLLALGLGLAVNALLARTLTPSELGGYFLALTIAAVAAALIPMGLGPALVRLVADAESRGEHATARALTSGALRMVLVASLACTVVLAIGLPPALDFVFEDEALTAAATLVACLAALTGLRGMLAEGHRAFHDLRSASMLSGPVSSLLTGIALAVAWTGGSQLGLREALAIPCVACAVAVAVSGGLTAARLRTLPNAPPTAARTLASAAFPHLLDGVLVLLLTSVDVWILGANRPPDEVAVYGVAARLALLVGIPLVVVNRVLGPIVAQLQAQGREIALERALRGTATAAAIPSILAGAALLAFPERLPSLVFGEHYAQSAGVLRVLVVGTVFQALTGSCGLALAMSGHQRRVNVVTVLTGFGAVVGAILTVRTWGAMGVAVAFSLSTVVRNVAFWRLARVHLGLWTHPRLRPRLSELRRLVRPIEEESR